MGKGPGQISGHQGIKTVFRKIRFFRVHDLKLQIQSQHTRHVSGMSDHIRCQINSDDFMSFRRQKAGKKSRTGANIQDSKSSAGRKILSEFRKPALPFFTFILPKALGLKPLRPLRPVTGDPPFDHIFAVVSFYILFFHK